MIDKIFEEYWETLTFKDPKLKELLLYVVTMLNTSPELIDSVKLIDLIEYYMQELNPIATAKANNLCTSMSVLLQMLPYDKYLESYMVKQRAVAHNNGSVLKYPEPNDLDKKVDQYVGELEQFLTQGNTLETQMLLPSAVYNTLIQIGQYVSEVRDTVNALVVGAKTNEKMLIEAKNQLAQALMEKKALQTENNRLNQIISSLRSKIS